MAVVATAVGLDSPSAPFGQPARPLRAGWALQPTIQPIPIPGIAAIASGSNPASVAKWRPRSV
jgi:hypothetical protein